MRTPVAPGAPASRPRHAMTAFSSGPGITPTASRACLRCAHGLCVATSGILFFVGLLFIFDSTYEYINGPYFLLGSAALLDIGSPFATEASMAACADAQFEDNEATFRKVDRVFRTSLARVRDGAVRLTIPTLHHPRVLGGSHLASLWDMLSAEAWKCGDDGAGPTDLSEGDPDPKFACNFERVGDRPCVVYSARVRVGLRGETRFERQVARQYPGCQIHVLDPTVRATFLSLLFGSTFLPPRVAIHKIGLGGTDTDDTDGVGVGKGSTGLARVKMRKARLQTVMTRLGHTFIDVLKIDIEGSEWRALDDIFGGGILTTRDLDDVFEDEDAASNGDDENPAPRRRAGRFATVPLIGHILVKVHLTPRISPGRTPLDVLKMHHMLMEHGYRLVRQQVLPSGSDQCCDLNELSYVHRLWQPERNSPCLPTVAGAKDGVSAADIARVWAEVQARRENRDR